MSELISGKEAKLAWANGEDVQAQYQGVDKWATLISSSKFCISNFENPLFKFRLKPQTIKLTIEVPKPFEPKVDEVYWVLDTNKVNGYSRQSEHIPCLAWRTEDEIKQVVAELRKLKG